VSASAARQATGVIKTLQGDILRSVGTVRNYEQGLTRVAEWMKDNRLNHGNLRTLTPTQAITYLEQRGEQVGQKTLDMERQA
ncbi:site-specific integrase, partial [Klebsiella pneumoniae]|nr:site-specific integrase [Klebsiella pneumoniae]